MLSASCMITSGAGIMHWAMSLKTNDVGEALNMLREYTNFYYPGYDFNKLSITIVDGDNNTVYATGMRIIPLEQRLSLN